MELIRWLQTTFPGLEGVFLALTQLGSENAFIVLLAGYYWLINPSMGRRLGMVLGLSFALNGFLKNTIGGPRPFEVDPSLASQSAIATAPGGSMPSGHSQGSATYWFFVAWVERRRWLWGVAIAVVALIGLSRIYLGLHYGLDVVVGIGLGALLAYAASALPSREAVPGFLKVFALAFLAMLAVSGGPDVGRGLGVMAGFFLASASFKVPKTTYGRLGFAGVGLVLVALLFVATSIGLGEYRQSGWGAFLRYTLLAYWAAELWPQTAQRFFR